MLIDFLSIPGEAVMIMAESVVTDDMGRILASVYDGDLDSMKKLIENREINEYVRSATLRGMTTLVANGIENREKILNYFKELFQGRLERDASIVWYALVSSSMVLYPDVVQEEIKSAFDDGLISELFLNYHDVAQVVEDSKEKTLANLSENRKYKLIEDTVKEMSWWACFSRDSKKIGRNKPCPCGSGKKYKKCCGA